MYKQSKFLQINIINCVKKQYDADFADCPEEL